VQPAIAMCADFVPAGHDHAGDLRGQRQRGRGDGDRAGDAVLRQHAEYTLRTGADAVLIVALVGEVANWNAQRDAEFVHRFWMLVTRGDALFRTFL
jgi:hypothetical protein